jgi:hypothetical protein
MSCLSYNLISDRLYIPSSQPQLRRCPSPSLWHINSCTQYPIMNLHLYVAQRFLDRANLHSTLYHYAPLSHMLNLPHFTDQCFRSSYLWRVQEKVHSTHADYSPRLCQDPFFILPSSFCQDRTSPFTISIDLCASSTCTLFGLFYIFVLILISLYLCPLFLPLILLLLPVCFSFGSA